MDLLIGGVSSLHDPLLAAALRGRGVSALALPTPRAEDLELGRRLLPRATPNPGLYLVGATLRQLRAMAIARGSTPAEVAAGCALACVSGRYFHHASQHREAWRAAGVAALGTVAVEFGRLESLAALAAQLGAPDARVIEALVEAAAIGDALSVAGCEARATWTDAPVDAALASARDRCALALASGAAAIDALSSLPTALAGTRRRAGRRVRVRVTGDFFSSMTDGDGGDGVTRSLGARGARVLPPTLGEWILLWLWRARGDASPTTRAEIDALGATLRGAFARAMEAAGVTATLHEPDDLAALATEHYPAELLDAPGFMEAGLYLAAVMGGSADLVVSVKPFATTPSSAVSDAVLHALARRSSVGFLAIETNGDARAQVESRLDLALDLAGAPTG